MIAASLDDPARFGRLIRTHSPAVLRYLTRRVGAAVAEDLAAETFLRAFRGRAGYQAVHGSALPWLYGIAGNVVRGHSRSELRRIEALGRMAVGAVSDNAEEHVDDALAAAGTLQRLAVVFGRLSDEARDVLLLVAVEGLSYEEASTALGIPVGTVRSRLSRARMDVRRALGSSGPPTSGERTADNLPQGAPRG